MGIWLTGDIHGEPRRFGVNVFEEQRRFNPENKDENIVIVLGDFGVIWRNEADKAEKYWLDWMEDRPFTIAFLDGNHENHRRLAEFPVKEWRGGEVHELRPHVLHLMRGEVFTIGGKKFFTFGGARSHDIQDGILDVTDPNWKKKAKDLEEVGKYFYRVRGLSWWDEEMPSEEEMGHGLKSLEKAGDEVDYILSHSPLK